MSRWKIAWRSIQQRALASSLTGISMALGVMLVVAVLVVHGVINQSFLNNSGLGYNVVVGAKGGRLDLVLNTVYYLARPVENIPYSYYQEFTEGRFKQYVDKAIPVCLGDMFREFRVIGTTPAFFDELDYGGKRYEFAAGENFKADDYFGAVIGATVAREAGLKVGDKFQPAHGVGPEAHVHDAFEVRGVLKPTGTPNDRGLFINMEGFYLIPEHAKSVDDEDAERAASDTHEAHDHEAHEHANHEHDPAHEHADEDHDGEHADAHEHEHDHDRQGAEAKPVDHHEDTDEDEHARPHRHAETASDKSAEQQEDEHADHDHADHGHAGETAHEEHDADADRDHAGHDHADHDHADHDHADHAHGHDHEHAHAPLPIEQREVTAILVLTASVPGAPPELMAPELIKKINKDSVAQAVLPIREMTGLFSTFVDPLQLVLLGLTVMIVIVSGIGILVSIYNSMSDRRHEIAVMRALGAGRRTVMFIVLLESILLSLAGGVAGWVVGHALITLLSPWISLQTGVSIGALQFVAYELVIIPGLIVLASVVGYLPALAAYRTDVARSL